MKFNLKNYWREILIAILIGLLLWVSSADRPQRHTGSSDTVCVVDTVTHVVPGATLVKYIKVRVSLTDTMYLDTSNKFAYPIRDTSWLYADVPVNEYRDSAYYARAIGWLDSIAVYHPVCVTNPVKTNSVQNYGVTIFANTHLANGVVAPGVTVSVKRLQLGYNWNLINQSGVVTIGYRIR